MSSHTSLDGRAALDALIDCYRIVDGAFPTDIEPRPHPAKFSPSILDKAAEIIDRLIEDRPAGAPKPIWLDVFGGTGRIHWLGDTEQRIDLPHGDKRSAYGLAILTLAVELMPGWAIYDPRTICGDSTRLLFPDGSIDGIFSSPTYPNRINDHFLSAITDKSIRFTYRHFYGRTSNGFVDTPLPETSTARYQGRKYWELHERIAAEMFRVLKSGAPLLWNVSDSFVTKDVGKRKGGGKVSVRIEAVDRHIALLEAAGFEFVERHQVHTPRSRMGSEKSQKRAEFEEIVLLRRP